MSSEDLRTIRQEICRYINSLVLDLQTPQDSNMMQVFLTRIESVSSSLHYLHELDQEQFPASVIDLIDHATNLILLNVDEPSAPTISKRGRPIINVSMSQLEFLMAMNFKVPEIAKLTGVSRETIFRRLRANGLSMHDLYSTITDLELSQLIEQLLSTHPNTGYKRMKGYLLSDGVKVTDRRIREIMRRVDPEGVYQRTIMRNRVIRRRNYYVPYSNSMWHLDGNLKLIRWGFVIRSGIDGKSRTVTYIKASCDNRSETHLRQFLTGVERFGIPSRTRSDKGGENVNIARFMIQNRGLNRRSHICGRSVHNQRIERFWRDVFDGCTSFYIQIFNRLEEDGHLNLDDERHMLLLHRFFLPLLNDDLLIFQNGWNNHPLSTEGNKTPIQLFYLHLPPQDHDAILSEEDLAEYRFACDNFEDLRLFGGNSEDNFNQPHFDPEDLTMQQIAIYNEIITSQNTDSRFEVFVRLINNV